MSFAPVTELLADIRAGRMVVVVDDEQHEPAYLRITRCRD